MPESSIIIKSNGPSKIFLEVAEAQVTFVVFVWVYFPLEDVDCALRVPEFM